MTQKNILCNIGTKVLVVLVIASTGDIIQAAESQFPTPAEMSALPPYCAARLGGNTSPEFKRWHDIMGPFFISIHHYCFALNDLNRSYSRPGERGRWLQAAINQLDYVLKNPPMDHPLTPEIYMRRGSALKLAGRTAEAMEDYSTVIRLNPKLRRPYLELADYYVEGQQKVDALKIVSEGLTYRPDDKKLQARYIQLGGKLPYPQPREQPTSKEDNPMVHK